MTPDRALTRALAALCADSGGALDLQRRRFMYRVAECLPPTHAYAQALAQGDLALASQALNAARGPLLAEFRVRLTRCNRPQRYRLHLADVRPDAAA